MPSPFLLALAVALTGEAAVSPLEAELPALESHAARGEQGAIPPLASMTPQERLCMAKVTDPVADRYTYWACVSEAVRGQQMAPDVSGVPLE